jgi:hypothetical protein
MLWGAPLPVGILDAQDMGAARATGEEPVEQGGTGAPHVEISRRRRGEAYSRRGH